MTTGQVRGPAIHVRALQKSYGELHVLRGVDFDVARGSIFALLGSNGAGKTTVVRILSTLLKADEGTVTVAGFDVATQAANVRESISLTGQFAAVDEVLTGGENLVLMARLRRVKDAGHVADDLLARFQLTDAARRRVATYSGGMRRRLDIAMSLIGNPPVIFLDEPTTGLDPQGRIEVWHTVKELAGQGTTVLLTTQHLDDAEQLADRIVLESATPPGTDEEAPAAEEPATEEHATEKPAATAPVTTLESRRAPRPGRRVMPWAAGMAAAGLAIGLLTGRALWSDTPPAPPTIAQAQLDTLETNQRLGQARVIRAGASVDLTVATTAPFDARNGFIEVWLINKDGKRMVSVGVLNGSAPETFPITQTLLDQGYIIVDISREGFDNKPQHSGDSLARGTLRT